MNKFADRIFINAKVYSVAIDGTLTQAEAIAVKDGKILCIGPDAEVKAYAGDKTIITDCKSASVIPSFVDAHVHLARSADGFYTKDTNCKIYTSAGIGMVSGIEKRENSFRELSGIRRFPGERFVGAYMIRPETAGEDLEKAIAGKKEIAGNDSFFVSVVTYRLDNDDFAMSTPYTAEYCRSMGKPEGYCGTLLWDEEALKESVRNAAQSGFHIRITAHGDRAVQVAVDAILYAKDAVKTDAVRYSISHLAYVREEDKKRMAEHGITAVLHPGKFEPAENRAATRKENVGKRYREAYPYGSLISAGVPCACGLMFDSSNQLNPFTEIIKAGNRRKGEEVNLREAIRSATICGAYLFGLDEVTGSIEVGKSADFLILNKDIESNWRKNSPVDTVFRGNIVYSTRKGEEAFYSANIVKQYRQDIKKYPALNRAEEQELAARIVEGDMDAVDRLVRSSLYVALREAEKKKKRICYYNMSFEDLIGAANVGLVRAAKSFKPGKGAAFATYAFYYIRDEIEKAIKTSEKGNGKDIESIYKLYRIENEYFKEYGKAPGEEELAERMRVPVQKVRSIRAEMKGGTLSIDETLRDVDEEDSGTLRVDELILRASDLSDEMEKRSETDLLEELLRCLTDDERGVIRYFYGLDQVNGNLTYRDIARKMKKTFREVMALEASAKRKMIEKTKEMEDFI